MLWWIAAVALALLAVALFLRRQWISPWAQLERLVGEIKRGEQPRTFLVSGNRHAWQIGVALEDLLKRRQQLDEQVSEESAEMRAIFAALSDALVVLDEEQRIRFCNPAFERLFRPAAIGMPLLEATRDAEIEQTIRSALGRTEAHNEEISHSGKTFQLVVVPIARERGRGSGIVAIFHDISRLKQTEQMRRDFVANVSHELRTPLSIFRGNVEALLDDRNLDREGTDHILSVLKRHSDRLNRLVEELLVLARFEAKETTLQLAPLEPAAFLNRVARDWSRRLAKKDLSLAVQTDDNLPLLCADELRFEQVMHNLLENAVNYSPQSGQITVSARRRDERVVLSVADQGKGIAPADLPRIFERFYRADKARSRELGSTGLGLSIVKHIVQLHGGDVRAESEPGKGTTIHVSLPAHAAEFTQL